jgi:hypothetical protein
VKSNEENDASVLNSLVLFGYPSESEVPALDKPLCSCILNESSKQKIEFIQFYYKAQHDFVSSSSVISASSIAWLEMSVVEISLRNRDRFAVIWPILKKHYLETLTNVKSGLSYITER